MPPAGGQVGEMPAASGSDLSFSRFPPPFHPSPVLPVAQAVPLVLHDLSRGRPHAVREIAETPVPQHLDHRQ
jgi:hypothetical protein